MFTWWSAAVAPHNGKSPHLLEIIHPDECTAFSVICICDDLTQSRSNHMKFVYGNFQFGGKFSSWRSNGSWRKNESMPTMTLGCSLSTNVTVDRWLRRTGLKPSNSLSMKQSSSTRRKDLYNLAASVLTKPKVTHSLVADREFLDFATRWTRWLSFWVHLSQSALDVRDILE